MPSFFFYLAFQFGQRPCPEVSPSVISPSRIVLCHATTSDPASASSCLVSGRGVALLPPSNCASLALWLVFVKVPRPPAVLSVIGRVAESDKGRRGRVICPFACTYPSCSPITRLYLRYGPCLIRHRHITWSYGPTPAPMYPASRLNRRNPPFHPHVLGLCLSPLFRSPSLFPLPLFLMSGAPGHDGGVGDGNGVAMEETDPLVGADLLTDDDMMLGDLDGLGCQVGLYLKYV